LATQGFYAAFTICVRFVLFSVCVVTLVLYSFTMAYKLTRVLAHSVVRNLLFVRSILLGKRA